MFALCWKFGRDAGCFPQDWTTACSSTSRPSRRRKSGGTSCCESPTRNLRIWECLELATRSWYWRLWTFSVLWWVQASHAVVTSHTHTVLVNHVVIRITHRVNLEKSLSSSNKKRRASHTRVNRLENNPNGSNGFGRQTLRQIYQS